ncbi:MULTISPECIES: methyltransferase domain-containing protein [Staphylococcus]|uniref:Tellurite resistance methyltransferase TehB-like domain-containing protein n=1 Tax=Staphylococcus simulans UMC-CNS-990 TaxID=1405498 RepID=A0ABN0PG83_STASI|nr:MULTISPECIES: methyltransferase domain-containing protein [Staphylococcus]ERS94658.1 hypothetical protein SSIM_00765 [Staphylococcus simulans UMC-CNS-990]MCE5024299.1 methyltransferase domain-containing protein [Staphylococcus simulans]MCE5147926.1 methyltransferase domain-containing protein [Staphylococcus simulans]MDT4011439.1 methyltransferase domain-containing protein [Staphylococcus simulans]OFJ73400.1 hypothetical protein HMPREF2846_02420 [Staphylococcus sp. HMSC056G08]
MNHWDEKFDSDTYIYGKEANQYVKSVFSEKVDTPKKVLMLAEGEGRNAVYLATLGYDVTTYDLSKVGIEKELKLAEEAGVTVDANYGDITASDLTAENAYDYSVNIFGHVPPEGKRGMFNNLIKPLKSEGHSYFELYSTEQLENKTGGPPNKAMLYEVDEIKGYLEDLPVKIHSLEKRDIERKEGTAHTGHASVIQGHIEKL